MRVLSAERDVLTNPVSASSSRRGTPGALGTRAVVEEAAAEAIVAGASGPAGPMRRTKSVGPAASMSTSVCMVVAAAVVTGEGAGGLARRPTPAGSDGSGVKAVGA